MTNTEPASPEPQEATYTVSIGRRRWEWADIDIRALSPQEALREAISLAEEDSIDGDEWSLGEIDLAQPPVADACINGGPVLAQSVPTDDAATRALRVVLPYAISRVEDMSVSATMMHHGKPHRCSCYVRARQFIAAAAMLLGDPGSVDEQAVADDLVRKQANDPAPPDSPCAVCKTH